MYITLKRIFDIIGAIVGLILFGPIFLIISLWIVMVSPGPVFADIPNRIGKDKKTFRMYKFRSMIPNAHEFLLKDPALYAEYKKNDYKLENDPRWIKGAVILRKYSLDELPQFINVLLGNMSLVGPRAYYPFELRDQQKEYPEAGPYIEQLLKVKPGITGPWQVGGRSELSFMERVKLDADYSYNTSILYDLVIILKTPFAAVSGKGTV